MGGDEGRRREGREGKGTGGEGGEGRGEEAFLVMWPKRFSALNPPLNVIYFSILFFKIDLK